MASSIVDRGQIRDEKKLLEAVKKVLSQSKPKAINPREIYFALPEAVVYDHIFSMELDKKRRTDLIMENVKNNIPVLVDDLIFDFKTIKKDKDKEDILFVGVEKGVVRQWYNFFKKAKLSIKFFDIESLAMFRALLPKSVKGPVCVIDIGLSTSKMYVYDSSGVRGSYHIPNAGKYFSKILMEKLKIDMSEAVKIKKKINITDDSPEAKALVSAVDLVMREAKNFVKYWDGKFKTDIGEIILVGGSSKIKGLAPYIENSLKIKTILGSNILKEKNNDVVYLGAIGLALRGLGFGKNDVSISLDKKSLKQKKEKVMVDIEKDQPNALRGGLTEEAVEEARGSKSKIIILSVVVVLGIVLILGSLWYRMQPKDNTESARDRAIQQVENLDQ